MSSASDSISQVLGDISPKAIWEQVAPHLRPAQLVLPLATAPMEMIAGVDLVFCSEALQHTGSFKLRAAMAVALNSQAAHVITASSGNFGAALALAAHRTGKRCTVVMPHTSSRAKVAAVTKLGAQVDTIDTEVVSRKRRVEELVAADPGAQAVSPYDDPYVIVGNGSLGAELFAEIQPDVIITPIGGGGLASGLIVARQHLAPRCEIWGAEPRIANDAARSLRDGELRTNSREPATICDGVRTLALGQRNFAILKEHLAGIIEVEEEAVTTAVRWLFHHANLKAEPTGALALAGLLTEPRRFANKRVVCIVSGGNVDASVYAAMLSETGNAPPTPPKTTQQNAP